jgi:hypothetical protein
MKIAVPGTRVIGCNITSARKSSSDFASAWMRSARMRRPRFHVSNTV